MMNEEELKKIQDALKQQEERIKKLESLFSSKQIKPKKECSVKEFLLSKKPKDDVQKTIAIGYYLENYQGMGCYNKHDLKTGFRNAKEKVPDNINYKVIRCIQRGFLQEAETPKDGIKAWTLTSTGETFVENGFEDQ